MVGEARPLIPPGAPDGLGEGEGDGEGRADAGGDGGAGGVAIGDAGGVGAGGSGLMTYVTHAGAEVTGGSTPHTRYEPGPAPVGGAVDGVELMQMLPEADGVGLVAQPTVLPKDHDTSL